MCLYIYIYIYIYIERERERESAFFVPGKAKQEKYKYEIC